MRRFLSLRSLINSDAIVDTRRKLVWTWGQYPSPPPKVQVDRSGKTSAFYYQYGVSYELLIGARKKMVF